MAPTKRMDTSALPQNNSHQQLMGEESDGQDTIVPSITSSSESNRGFRTVTCQEWITVAVLCYVNLINYMDRYTMAGIMNDIRGHFSLNDKEAGLLQTVFVISYMIFAPIFGYLGDRYNRKIIMAAGVFLWSLTTLLGSYMDTYGGFLGLRACVGIGEASYSTIAPTILSDLFVKDLRAKMLALFYFAIPVGSGLGYIVGAKTALLAGQWQWALRVTPVAGALAVILILAAIKEPERGESEGREHLALTSWSQDLRYLLTNRSFMLSTAGFTCVSFVAGALAWWGPDFIVRGVKLLPEEHRITADDISFKFGIVAVVSGAMGVPFGQYIASKLKTWGFAYADPVVCAAGLIGSVPLLFIAMLAAGSSTSVTFALVFFGMFLLNLNWSIVADMLLYVVIPTRRSTAEAFQILISHALGDAGSPYLIGAITDSLSASMNATNPADSPDIIAYYSLQYSLFSTCFIEVIGGLFFLATAIYIVRDRKAADQSILERNIQDVALQEGLLTSGIKPTIVK